jgi:hypothetical protein
MSTTYTPNIGLPQAAAGDRTWNVPVNGCSSLIDAQNAIGDLGVQSTEVPSVSLNVKVAGGVYINQSGAVQTYAGTSSYALAAMATNYLYLDLVGAGPLAKSTVSFPASPHVRIAVVVTVSAVSTITDARVPFTVCGPFADGTAWQLGTSSGLKIATATDQKLGFFGQTPVVQPTLGAATAGTSYTSNEQAMLNAVYAAVRTLGLGS